MLKKEDLGNQDSKQTLVTLEYSKELGCLGCTIPFAILAIWAASEIRLFWTIICVLIIAFMAHQVYISFNESNRFSEWLKNNDGTYIFFYPTKREVQAEISELIGNRIDSKIKRMYYDKSKIVGDLKNQTFIKQGLGQLNREYPNHPRLIQITGDRVVEIINLFELNRIDRLGSIRIDEIVREINTYA